MEVQVREKCWQCKGTGRRNLTKQGFPLAQEDCDCQDGYLYSWIDIGELASKMERAKIVWEDEQKRERWWNS